MTQLCKKCSRTNPREAVFCYFDGTVLDGHAVPRADAGHFPTPFHFPDGRVCRTFDELALACVQQWPAACDLFADGVFAAFFANLGRADLAQAADRCGRFPDGERGLDQLLGALPTDALSPARLRVEPAEVNLGVVSPDQPREFELELENQGDRLVFGSASSSDAWLTLGDGVPAKRFQFLRNDRLRVRVDPGRVRAGHHKAEARLLVQSNAGAVAVVVRVERQVIPFPDGPLAGLRTPREVADAARKRPHEIAPCFELGAVQRWYAANGWVYPVTVPVAAGVAGIQQFFEALGLAKPPRVEMSPRELKLQGAIGSSLTATLIVSTTEKRPVFAHAVSTVAWLQVSGIRLDGNRATIDLAVPIVPPGPVGAAVVGEVVVVANGNARWRVPIAVTLLAPTPVAPRQRDRRKRRGWWHAVPAILLLLSVAAVVAYDLGRPPAVPEKAVERVAGPNYDPAQLREPKPRLGIDFNTEDRFGVVLLDAVDPRDPGRWKRLTARTNGSTNNTVVRIGTSEYLFGFATPTNRLTVSQRPLAKPYHGWRSVMDFGDEKVRVTQHLQLVPGQDQLLDTLLVYYQATNYGTVPQKVAVRVMLDTFIGKNDGVPFTVPGVKGFVTKQAEYRSGDIPDYLEVVENPDDSKDPGTIARVGLRGLHWGDVLLQEPAAVRICRFPGGQKKWDWAMEDMQDDSCVAVYWPEQELAARSTTHLAMTYGLGKLDISDQLALSTPAAVAPGREFVVTAYVYNAAAGQKVTLEVPAGVELVGDAEQAVREAARRTQVFWKVKARSEGAVRFEAVSGRARARPVTVRVQARSIFG